MHHVRFAFFFFGASCVTRYIFMEINDAFRRNQTGFTPVVDVLS